MVGARTLALLFVDTTELEILKNTELFLHVLPISFLSWDCFVSCVTPSGGRVYKSGYAFRSFRNDSTCAGQSLAVSAFGYLAVCFGDRRHGLRLSCSWCRIYFCISEVAPDEERTVSIIPVPPPGACAICRVDSPVTSCSSIISLIQVLDFVGSGK